MKTRTADGMKPLLLYREILDLTEKVSKRNYDDIYYK